MDEKNWTNLRTKKDQSSMQWGQIVISSLATLIITILAGVVVFYFTRQETPQPKIYYERVSSTAFSTDKIKTVIHSFRVWNEGDKEADDIQVEIILPTDATIIEQKADTSAGLTIKVDIENIDSHTLLAKIPSLNSGESVTFAFLLSDTTKDSIDIKVRGKGFIGQERTITTPTENVTSRNEISKTEIYLLILVITILYSAFVAYYYLFIRKRRLARGDYGELDFNNYGFRLLHIGKYQEAKKYIQSSIDKEPGVYNLGNMAHIIALEGDFKTAKEFYEIARDYDSDKGSDAFLNYCIFCINLLNGDKDKALSYLARALELDRKRITNYINRNNNLGKWKDDKDILQLIYKST